jgi:hypothetical protein
MKPLPVLIMVCFLAGCANCGTCPDFSPPAPGFCQGGLIVDGGRNECGCASPPKCIRDSTCTQDSDCACGRHRITGDCFYGNREYVNTSAQCPDFCTGIAGNFETKCLEGVCKQAKHI